MTDLTGTNNVPKGSTAVALGLFDGVHHGHRAVIGRAVEAAKNVSGTEPAVFTFDTATVTSKGTSGVEYIFSRETKFDKIYIFSGFYELQGSFGRGFCGSGALR